MAFGSIVSKGEQEKNIKMIITIYLLRVVRLVQKVDQFPSNDEGEERLLHKTAGQSCNPICIWFVSVSDQSGRKRVAAEYLFRQIIFLRSLTIQPRPYLEDIGIGFNFHLLECSINKVKCHLASESRQRRGEFERYFVWIRKRPCSCHAASSRPQEEAAGRDGIYALCGRLFTPTVHAKRVEVRLQTQQYTNLTLMSSSTNQNGGQRSVRVLPWACGRKSCQGRETAKNKIKNKNNAPWALYDRGGWWQQPKADEPRAPGAATQPP